jgi:hypothetical protein
MRSVLGIVFAALSVAIVACSSFSADENKPPDSSEAGASVEAGGAADAGGDTAASPESGSSPTSTLGNGLISRWRFDEGSGTTAANDVAGAPAGIVSNATWASGKLGGALQFNSSNSVVTVPSSPSLAITSAYTLAVWVNLGPKTNDDQRFVHRDPIDFKLNGRRPQIGTAGMSYATSSYALPGNEWHHIAATVENGAPRMYVDGTERTFDTQQLDPRPIPAQSAPLYIGAFGDGYGVANGLLDDVRMWNRALTPAEVLELSKQL